VIPDRVGHGIRHPLLRPARREVRHLACERALRAEQRGGGGIIDRRLHHASIAERDKGRKIFVIISVAANMNISPWQSSVELTSPDGELLASIMDAVEIAMGGPTRGLLRFSNGFAVDGCNPSIVWSSDSKYLAVAQWVENRMQKLLVVEPAGRRTRVMPGSYRVLRLESFEGGVIRGVDSPIHMPVRLEVAVTDEMQSGGAFE